ncbi:GNAT family N-acetyltransferase [Clostridium paridis]|uniref:GNAT family N-acetyltransferase n=1 Tax=Clostridium paridis TaxID=2803863 RepID=A0A937K4G3_9CLOT|nr:GNAT family N-acetyltransferase [Clostridium paridis]MBL4931170.1 GNAT family N-acetyltransferase [Clostridium paridis]
MLFFDECLESDASILKDIALRAFEEDRIKYGAIPPNIDTLEWHISKVRDGMYYKIIRDDKIIGAFKLYEIDKEHFRLGAIFIDPEYHNEGVGSEALEFIEKEYSNIKKWSLDTPYKNFRNQYFYEKHGYVKIGEYKPLENNSMILFEYNKEKKKDIEKVVRKYFKSWIDRDECVLREVFAEEAIYIESYGPVYNGLKEIQKWFRDWNKRGKVIAWDIKNIVVTENTVICEWYFKNEFDGKVDDFNGVSWINFDKFNKIIQLKEFAATIPNYLPYRNKEVYNE